MRPESRDGDGRLRTGLTTGVCATAAATAAARLALGDQVGERQSVVLPKGKRVELVLNDLRRTGEGAEAGVIKDGGDDPDATHGARVWVRVEPRRESGITFHAGAGVGVVTRSGLPVAVGEPAINPVPRRMMTDHLLECAAALGHRGGFSLFVGVDDGERIAERTMNGRLGIQGGLSILGTTGIVRPFSCAAYIASIHQSIDVARANGITHLACCTGGSSEAMARARYRLGDMALIEMGDLIGGVLKYIKRHPVPRVTLAGGFGKLSKFAAGHADTHSRKCAIDLDGLAREAAALGADTHLRIRMTACNTSIEALSLCQNAGIPLADRICARAYDQARRTLPDAVMLDVCAVDRGGRLVGTATTGVAA
ncbi:cobalt-precorrin-5B (C(1))-methyltransferase [Aquisalimonas asiatica]|uniref:Cobalt-precorrin-5B C(1)-methyltransferase n=1 Tax=Aquisalimonas asiatica TaxID=406100 RepID=A0A1H8U9Y3_9GAMM|nr:cobalt-precorrin-5B (C(1))-methyltransferase [Aquisalimonas asiatica]SEO99847.1 cobalt-precorrin-5B (C1)-methyltransferase [Aquisalimonas asiatica]